MGSHEQGNSQLMYSITDSNAFIIPVYWGWFWPRSVTDLLGTGHPYLKGNTENEVLYHQGFFFKVFEEQSIPLMYFESRVRRWMLEEDRQLVERSEKE